MSELKLELTGKTAIIAIAVGVALVGYRVATIGQPSDDPELERRVRTLLMSEAYPAGADAARTALESGDDAAMERVIGAMSEGGVTLHSIEVSEPLTAFGPGQREAVVKVSYTLTTGDRAGEPLELYYLFEHTPLSGHWSYRHETSSFRYITNLM